MGPPGDAKAKAALCWEQYQKVVKCLGVEAGYDEAFLELRREGSIETLRALGRNCRNLRHLGPSRDIDALLREADEPTNFESATKQLAEEFGASWSMGPTKKKVRAVDKAENDYGGDVMRVVDLKRCSIVLKSAEDLVALFERARTAFGDKGILRVKNSFLGDSAPGGYRDVKLNVAVGDHSCELQLHLDAFHQLKADGHKYYEWARALPVSYGTSVRDPFDLFGSLTAAELAAFDELLGLLAASGDEQALGARGRVLLERGDAAGAERCFRDYLACAQSRDADDDLIFYSKINLMQVLDKQGKHDEAAAFYAEAHAQLVKARGAEHPNTLALGEMVAMQLVDRCVPEGVQRLADILEARLKALGDGHPCTIKTRLNLGYAFAKFGRHRLALATGKLVFEALEESQELPKLKDYAGRHIAIWVTNACPDGDVMSTPAVGCQIVAKRIGINETSLAACLPLARAWADNALACGQK